jgi:hypothetical protein
MHIYYGKKPTMHRSPPVCKRCKRNAKFLLSNQKIISQDEEYASFRYHLVGIARVGQKWWKSRSKATQAVLAIVALCILSHIINTLIRSVDFSMNSIYMILGVLASAVVIYEFLSSKLKRRW